MNDMLTSSLDQPPILDRQSFQTGRVIFQQGQEGDCAYILQSGAVEIVRDTDDGKITLGRLAPGSIFGEMALIDDAPRMAGAVAVEPCTVIVIRREMLKRKLDKADPFLVKLLCFLVQNVRNITNAHVDGAPLTRWLEDDGMELFEGEKDPGKELAQGPFIRRRK
jgi:CRP-like cAMP-binding protein